MPNAKQRQSWRETFSIYLHPRVASMLFLGFSAGLPYLLVFTTLTAWLTEAGVNRARIGFFSWIGITYSIKVLWAPIVDRVQLPILGRLLGKRRSWILFAQLLIASGLVGMALTDPAQDLRQLALLALVVAFGSATQDVAIDAWRIEAASVERQAAMSAVYVFAYRIALLVAGAGALHLVAWASWPGVYLVMALLMATGMVTVLVSKEPEVKSQADTVLSLEAVQAYLARSGHLPSFVQQSTAWFIGAVLHPIQDFFQRYGSQAVILLLVVGSFRITDISMGAMALPFYLDLGFTRAQIANISGIWGVGMTILGGMVGGLLVPRYGLLPMLFTGAILAAATNLLFSLMAVVGNEAWMLMITISADNFCGGLAMAVLIAWMSSLVNKAYTATQYALFSSLMTLPGKFIGGFSGVVVEAHGYFWFFIYVAALGLPVTVLIAYLLHRGRQANHQRRIASTAEPTN